MNRPNLASRNHFILASCDAGAGELDWAASGVRAASVRQQSFSAKNGLRIEISAVNLYLDTSGARIQGRNGARCPLDDGEGGNQSTLSLGQLMPAIDAALFKVAFLHSPQSGIFEFETR